jgi:hypothetical protein
MLEWETPNYTKEHCKGIVLREVLFTSVDKDYIWASLPF